MGALLAIGLSLGVVTGGRAAVVTPVSVATTSYWSGATDGKPGNMIDGSGLSGGGPLPGQTHDNHVNAATMWHAGDVVGALGGPAGTPPSVSAQAVVFDLGALHDLAGAYIWNHNQGGLTTRGVDQFQILTSADANPLTATYTNLGSFQLAQAAGGPAEPAQFVAFTASQVRLVKIDISTAHSGASSDFVGLSEVRFATTVRVIDSALVVGAVPELENAGGTLRLVESELDFLGRSVFVPEPGFLWHLVPGMALLGALLRRRRNTCVLSRRNR